LSTAFNDNPTQSDLPNWIT